MRKIRTYRTLFKEKKIVLPEIGDEILTGKFKNKTEIVKGYGIGKKNQPTIITNKGEKFLFPFRIKKLM